MLAAVAGALGVVTISDGFLFVALQRHLDFESRFVRDALSPAVVRT
jgi:hypothetical protein